MATLASDNFDRADSDTLGTGWTEVVRDWDIVSNEAAIISGSGDPIASWDTALGASPAADYEVECGVRKGVSVGAVGVGGRYADTSNYYYARINTFEQTLKLLKVVAGSHTQLGSTYSAGQSTNNNYTLKLLMVGTALKVNQDGTERISTTDSAHSSAGKPILWGDANNGFFNNFAVYGTAAAASVIKTISGCAIAAVKVVASVAIAGVKKVASVSNV